MKTRIPTAWLATLAAAALLAGCSTTTDLNEKAAPVESRSPTSASAQSGSQSPGATASGTSQSQSRVATVDLNAKNANAASSGPAQRVVYFDFDSFAIKDEFKPVLEGHAKSLAGTRGKRMTVEGHTDERGGSEYNLALGQKRAEAVTKSLALLGVADTQMEAVSFGKERPADTGHDEAAWAKNRRAELKDR